jgi:WAS/WASL-interacting protein
VRDELNPSSDGDASHSGTTPIASPAGFGFDEPPPPPPWPPERPPKLIVSLPAVAPTAPVAPAPVAPAPSPASPSTGKVLPEQASRHANKPAALMPNRKPLTPICPYWRETRLRATRAILD